MTSSGTSRLGDLVTIVGGGTPARGNAAFFGGPIPWVTPKDMKSRMISGAQISITEHAIGSSAARLIPAGAVLVVVRSGVLKHSLPIGLTTVPVAINQDMKALLCEQSLHPPFLAHLLAARAPEILSWVRATTADNFSIDLLKRLPIPLPPLTEQRRIADILDKADSLRTKQQSMGALLETAKQSVFAEMFAVGVEQDLVRVTDCADVQGGLQVTTKRKAYPIEVPYLRVANVHRGRLDLDEIKTIRATEGEVRRTLLEIGDVLVVEGHGNPEEIGRAAKWDGSIARCVHQNHLIRVRFDSTVLPGYAEAYLNSPAGRSHLLAAANTTSGLNTISTSVVKEAPFLRPNIDAQYRFIERIAAIQKMMYGVQIALALLDNLFASLQHRAFRGEL